MKRLVISLFMCLVFTSSMVNAQEMNNENHSGWASGWKYAFSKDGMKEWKPEFTLRNTGGLFTSGPILTGGVRVDEKRSFALFLGQGDTWVDADPASIYSVRTGVAFRRYWHFGKRKTFAFYSDLFVGMGWIYKIDRPDELCHAYHANVGEAMFVGSWQPGVRIRFYKNIHVFLGPLLATDSVGLHFGIGF